MLSGTDLKAFATDSLTRRVVRIGAAARGVSTQGMVLLVVLFVQAVPARADYFLSPDSPTLLGGTTWESHEIVRNDAGSYSLERAFPAGTALDALHRMDSGDWLFSVSNPVELDGSFYDPRDVIHYDGAAFTLFFDGAAAGIPPGANLDAVLLDGGDAGDLVLSFDIPVRIAGATYDPADLVRFEGTAFTLFFDASAAVPPIPLSTNVIEADARAGKIFLSFDVPTRLGATTYMPGQVVTWDGATFGVRFIGDGWPTGSAMTGLALGECLDGDGDGFGEPGDASCPSGSLGDCDDAGAAVHPSAPQLCDGMNNDCNDPVWPTVPANEADADDDGHPICAGDCLDNDPIVFPGASQLCDGVNNDCNDPAWPTAPANEADADGDGFRICAADCADTDGTVWGTPGEVLELTLSGSTLSWSAPANPGAPPAFLLYDTIRSTNPADFVTTPPATCVESDDGPNTTAIDATAPPLGTAFCYLVRAQNACPGAIGIGSLGTTSSGIPRISRDCP